MGDPADYSLAAILLAGPGFSFELSGFFSKHISVGEWVERIGRSDVNAISTPIRLGEGSGQGTLTLSSTSCMDPLIREKMVKMKQFGWFEKV